MSGITDNNTALETMRTSNEDVLTLISNLKALLTSVNPVAFNMNDYTITVDSITKLIENYRNGIFDTVTIGGQSSGGKQIKLSLDANGNFQVTDTSGSLVTVKCAAVESSYIQNSVANNVVANHGKILKVTGLVSVSGGMFKSTQQTVDYMTANTLMGASATVGSLTIDYNINCNQVLCYGTRKLAVSSIRNVFYSGAMAIDNYNNLLTTSIPTTTNIWDMNAEKGSPSDIGFTNSENSMPGMICIRGVNVYSTMVNFKPTNVKIGFNGSIVDILISALDLPALMLWPTGYIDSANNRLVLTPFKPGDSGKDIYYLSGSTPWTIFRTLTVANGVAVFANPYLIPPFSCLRFIVDAWYDANSATSILEIA